MNEVMNRQDLLLDGGDDYETWGIENVVSVSRRSWFMAEKISHGRGRTRQGQR
jgi:hypothetical protein